MKIVVLGAGVIGTATAWYCAREGHEVVVVDRREGAGLETSFANGGQISVSHAEPWANPSAPLQVLKWLWREDAPLLFRLKADPAQWAWGLRFFRECLPSRTRANTERIARLSAYSGESLKALRAETGIRYDHLERGILNFYTDERELEEAIEVTRVLREHGIDGHAKTVDEAIAIEPALEAARSKIVGATYMASDESGDAHLFTKNLAALASARGVKFRFGTAVQLLHVEGERVVGASVNDGSARETLQADAFVVALGSYSPLLTRRIGIDIPVYPLKGYSATVEVADAACAPTVSLTDEAAKIVMSRLGNRLRIAGTAELAGYSTELNAVRCEALVRRAREFFPRAGHYEQPVYWTGLRPATPSNVPIVGRTRYPNLFLNTGHGTLGWTMACGSGRAMADIISGRKPQVDFGSIP